MFVIVGICIVGPYLLGVRPARPRDWQALVATIAFVLWLFGGYASLRSSWQPVVKVQLHSTDDASRKAALLLPQTRSVFSVVAVKGT
jgi:hypothetical protein